jgi:hypothetical protein
MDELLDNKIVLFFVGVALFLRIIFQPNEADEDEAEDADRQNLEYLVLLHEIQKLREEVERLQNDEKSD